MILFTLAAYIWVVIVVSVTLKFMVGVTATAFRTLFHFSRVIVRSAIYSLSHLAICSSGVSGKISSPRFRR